ncbi:ArnT family glycosyltransferase [Aquimarina agarivorans]|uniref:ArnT family glycosyltransferase n=1 Tax=Aquimarina agarivorans TaxID=980584 RepID=UPI000248FCFD|nr:glycosyltransferase family 39 protein [Aquimarina agarivorans]
MKIEIEKYPYLTIILFWLGIFCMHLGALDPNIMEARNFVTAREMLTDGNWLLTTMDGLPRYEKPPLPTWIVAFFGKIFGLENIIWLRLPSALITLIAMIVCFEFSKKLTKRKTYSLITTLVFGTSFMIIFAGRNGTWDIFAHSFILIAVYYLFQFFESSNQYYKSALMAGLFIGLSFMSKGPVSHYSLLLPFLIAYGIVYKYKNFGKKWMPLIAILLLGVVLSSWWAYYIYTYDTTDATRIAEKESGRWVGYEVKPIYYYWSFFMQSGVWTILAFVSLIYPYLKTRVFDKKVYKLVFLWTVASVVLLSLIPTKKSRYLLPVLFPLAFTAGFYIEYLYRAFNSKISKWEKFPVYFNYVLIIIIGLLFPAGAYLFFGEKLEGYYFNYILTSVLLFGTSCFIWYCLSKYNFPKVFYATIAFIFFIISAGFPLANAIMGNPNYNSISKITNSSIPVYRLEGITPEMLWDYGKKTNRISEQELLSIGPNQKIGVLTHFSNTKDKLKFLDDGFTIKFVETFDLNAVDSTKRGYKSRLKTDFYTVTKER